MNNGQIKFSEEVNTSSETLAEKLILASLNFDAYSYMEKLSHIARTYMKNIRTVGSTLLVHASTKY